MSTPAIPYIQLPEISLGFLRHVPVLGSLFDGASPPSIKPFGTLVALAVYFGSLYAMKRAKDRGFDPRKMNLFIYWVVGAGFIGAHVLDAVFYHPRRVASDPLYLFKLWDGLSSYGGFIGAITGTFAFRAYYKERVLPYVDTVVSCFPFAWLFGRAGCSVVHDHPGRVSDLWFAVKYPDLPPGMGRFDLGLYELILTIPLAILCHRLWRGGTRPYGFFVGLACAYYAPIRFVLDFFREVEGPGVIGGDPRYGGLTPAQWACFGLLAVGLYFLKFVATDLRNQIDPAELELARARLEQGDAPAEVSRSKGAVSKGIERRGEAKRKVKGDKRPARASSQRRATASVDKRAVRASRKA